jgi:gliding motility-associatede transport system auxiliary component
MREKASRQIPRVRIALNIGVQIALAAVIVFLLNYLSFERFKRWDLSHNRKYTLSPLTRRVLGSLKKELKIYVFSSPRGNKSPGAELFTDTEALLKEYQYAGGHRVRVESIDPYLNLTRMLELRDKYKFGAKDSTDNMVLLDYDGRQKSIPTATMADYADGDAFDSDQPPVVKDFRGEQVITSALIQLTEEKQAKIGLISGHGELPVTDDANLGRFRSALEHQNIVLQELGLEGLDKIPTELTALILAGPQYDLTEHDAAILHQYWEEGGRLLILLSGRAKTPVLDNLLTQLGISPATDLIVSNFQTQTEDKMTLDVYTHFLGVTPFLKPLAGVIGFFPGGSRSIDVNEAKLKESGIRATKALSPAIDSYWGEKDDFLTNNADPVFHPGVDLKPPLTIGWALEKGAVEDQSIQVRSSSRLVVIGNTDFIRDECLNRSVPDTNFLLLCINWLSDRQTLLAIPPKEMPIYTLDLKPGQLDQIVFIVVAGIPMLAAVLGTLVWVARRR